MKRTAAALICIITVMTQSVAMAMDLTCRGAIVTDFATGRVIYEQNADTPYVPASMTKLMALYVFFSEMESHGLDFNSEVLISKNVADMSVDYDLSNVPLNEGWTYTVDRLLSAVCVPSACAATVALAEAISGTEADFVALMNGYAADMGLQAHFVDCFGISGENWITPRSLAALAKKMIEDYPFYLNYSSMTSVVWNGGTYEATNKLLPGMTYAYPGVDGMKTGTTDEGGCCLTATAMRDGRRIISVEFGAPTDNTRFTDSIALLDYGFANYSKALDPFFDTACTLDGPDEVYFNEDFEITASLSNVSLPSSQRGEWLVNGVPIAGYQYDQVWVDNGSTVYFRYNPNFYAGDSLEIAFRLYDGDDTIEFTKTVKVVQEYAA